jgi:hypothetical protein
MSHGGGKGQAHLCSVTGCTKGKKGGLGKCKGHSPFCSKGGGCKQRVTTIKGQAAGGLCGMHTKEAKEEAKRKGQRGGL